MILKVGHGERVGWGFVVLDESGLQLFDLRFLSGGEVAPSEFVSCVPDFVQNIAQLVRSTLSGGPRGLAQFLPSSYAGRGGVISARR